MEIYLHSIIFIFCLQGTLHILPEPQFLHSACYGIVFSSLMDANCSTNEVIAPIDVSVGSKTNSSGCPDIATSEFTPSQFDFCCKPDNDGCIGLYQTFGNNSDPYKDSCVGRTQCQGLQAAFMDTLHLGCDQSIYFPQTNFMYMNYYCISENRIGIIPTASLRNGQAGTAMYLQGQTYPSEITSSFAECSLETECENSITVMAVDIRLESEGGVCKQSITIRDDVTTKSITCDDNNDYVTAVIYTSSSNYLTITFNNSMSTAGGFFWIGFTATMNGTFTLNCPVQSEVYHCETTTVETTSTTQESTTTTMAPVTNITTTTMDAVTNITDTETTNLYSESISTYAETTIKVIPVSANISTQHKSTAEDNTNNVVIAVTVTVGSLVILGIVIPVVIYIIKRRQKKQAENTDGNHLKCNDTIKNQGSMTNTNTCETTQEQMENGLVQKGGYKDLLTDSKTNGLPSHHLPPISMNDTSQSHRKKKKKKKRIKQDKLLEQNEFDFSNSNSNRLETYNDEFNSDKVQNMSEEIKQKKKKKKKKKRRNKIEQEPDQNILS